MCQTCRACRTSRPLARLWGRVYDAWVIKRVDKLLEKAYGLPRLARDAALDVLIATVLSQNTSDVNSARAYEAMRAAFPSWDDVMNAPCEELEGVLRPGGLARTKAGRIQRILRYLARRGALDLSYIGRLSDGDAEAELLGLEGVGLKTARCVLLFSFRRDVFPVDTHILRICKRLGVIEDGTSAEEAHARLGPLVPKGRCLALHINLIRHGRGTCHARNPACGDCVLRGLCSYARGALEAG